MTLQETNAISGWLEERFDGFILLGFPVDQPFHPDHGPALRMRHGMGTPKMQRAVTMLRMMADDIEETIRWWDTMADIDRQGPPPPFPPFPGEEWKE